MQPINYDIAKVLTTWWMIPLRTNCTAAKVVKNRFQTWLPKYDNRNFTLHFRMILSILYTMVETMRVPLESETEEQKRNRELFIDELGIL
jgi:hypothetical protein